jgi:Tfp pilus assembly protein PilO
MNNLKEYRMPLFIAGGAMLVAIILWVALIAPQNTKLTTLQGQSVALQSQEASVQARLTSLRTEGKKLSSNCQDLRKISTQIPSVQSPTDIDAQESSFESQFNDLAASSGVTLGQFSGFTPATTTATPVAGATITAGVTAVPTTLTVLGNFAQMTAFVNGLDNFPRLFVIQKFQLAYGAAASIAATGGSQPTTSATSASAGGTSGTPLWIGGKPTSATSGPYNLQITGSIYYTSTPDALAACTKATAAQKATK